MRAMEQLALGWEPRRRTYTVTELNAQIRGLLGSEFDDVWVAGEVSGCRTATSGHCYFTLKDREAQLRCVCFRASLRYMKFKPLDGLAILARGRVDVFEARGEYQLLVELIEPQGHGALQVAFEQLKRKLDAEGLFEPGRKRPLPRLPRRIGLVTSSSGAVIRDILQILERRFPGLHLRLYPALVQGEGSVEAVCAGLRYFSRNEWAEVVIVARGGGSLEDLWTFNEEAVARAIAASRIPVISAVGHETDFTIADFVADLRAPTPSAAAELVICTRQDLLDQIGAARQKLLQSVRYSIAMAARRLHQRGLDRMTATLHRSIGRSLQRVDELEYRLRGRVGRHLASHTRRLDALAAALRRHDLRLRFAEARRRLEASGNSMGTCMRAQIARSRARLDTFAAHLTQLSPLKILERGYAIVSNDRGEIVKAAQQAPEGSLVVARLARGRLTAKVSTSEE